VPLILAFLFAELSNIFSQSC